MTRIARLTVFTHANELGGKLWNPLIRWTTKHAVFVRLEDEQGSFGIGECWCFDNSPDALVAFLRTEVAPQVLGKELTALPAVFEHLQQRAVLTARHGMLASALSGVDIACWDLRARQQGQSVATLLNLAAKPSIPVYASAGLYRQDGTLDDLAQEMHALTEQGFDTVKMKVGGLAAVQDHERMTAVLDAIPKHCKLIIDGVYRYTPAQALALFERLPQARIEAFQSPVDAEDVAGMAALVREGVPVMAVETEHRPSMHRRLVEEGAVTFLQVAPVACGGISRLRLLAKLVDDNDVTLSLEVSSTAIALLAACHFAASTTAVAHVEWHTVHQALFEALASQDILSGRYPLPRGAGLGIDLPLQDVTPVFDQSAN